MSVPRLGLLLCLALLPATFASAPPAKPLKVVCTTGMVRDIVEQVAGARAQVSGIIGSGVDPHLYKATRNDIAALTGADVVFYNGLLLEGKMSDALVRVARGGKPVYAVTELLDETKLLEPSDLGGHPDPHVWMDVTLWSSAVEVVAGALTRADPDGANTYRENAERYRGELARLHEYVTTVIASIPEKQRVLVTAHDAFRYFGRAYRIEVRGIQGISTESEAGLEDINRLVDFLVARGVGAIFVETSVADRNVRALIEGAASRGANVRLGGTLFSDAMGAPNAYEGTYIGMIDHNATKMARALGGTAPPRGMQGKLAAE